MLLPPFAKHVVGRLISGSVFLTAAGLCSTVLATPTISTPPSTLTINENLALNSAAASVPARTQLNFLNFIQLVASTPGDSTSTFRVRLSVNHGAVYLSTTTGLAAAGGSLFDSSNAPVGPTLQHGPTTNIDSVTFQGSFA